MTVLITYQLMLYVWDFCIQYLLVFRNNLILT